MIAAGCDKWFSIGLQLFDENSARVLDIAAPHATGTGKLEALIAVKLQSIKNKAAMARELLTIAKNIPEPCYAAVLREAEKQAARLED